ncbi:MAG TPA: hypothetical protein VKU42_14620, partial [Candidatus Angelobacter sp.]|nr:hypothetical protein [Candidatus Angelobacter sp.]
MSELTEAPKVNTNPTSADVAQVIDRRNESRKYMQLNYWDEWEDVYRSSKCLTKKIMVKNKAGQDVEDTSRTNVCMPETSLTIRRNTARMTASAPQINYTSPSGNEDAAQKLSAWSYMQYDRSGEARPHRMMVQTGETFGWSVSKLWWDKIEVQRQYQRRFMSRDGKTVSYRDRAGVMKLQGAPDDEIDGAVEQNGPDLSDEEVAQAMAKLGDTVHVPQIVSAYEGPFSKNIFIGDVFIEPGCLTLDDSGWVVENYSESELWLKKMLKRTYIDPESQQEMPVFDPKAVQQLYDNGTWNPNQGTQQPYDLKTRFRTSVLNQQVPLFPTNLLPGKRFDILEQHSRDEDGTIWVKWVGNEAFQLGKMPLPWNLYGKYVYTEYVPLPDIISAIGDSTPRLHRFLQALHNATVGARKDLVSQLLRPLILQAGSEDGVADDAIERKLFKVLQVRNLNNYKPFIEPGHVLGAVQAANEEEAQIMQAWNMSEPTTNNVDAGTAANPQAGKTATTAVLAAKSADALTQFKLDQLHIYLKEQGQKKLWMLQQNESDDGYSVGSKYVNKISALSERYGKTAGITIYPDEIQEDLQVEPEAMSMLSVDDDIRRTSAQQLAQAASMSPGIYDPYYVARFYAGTIRGVDPDKAVPPPKPQPPVMPKVNVTVNFKGDELPIELQQQIFSSGGLQITPEVAQEMNETG